MRSFLKWAGSKHQILDKVKASLPDGQRLIEPFVGSGTVFLNTQYPEYLLSEVNPDVINIFKCLQKEKTRFIDYCQQFFTEENNAQEAFYDLRKQFNACNLKDEPRLRAGLFLYLNRHCYNGLTRYNQSGIYNVPFGRYTKPFLPIERMKHFIEHTKKAKFICQDFTKTMQNAKSGDIVYCDPPYVPLTDTAYFTQYASQGFDHEQQKKLAQLANECAQRGVSVIISNHDTEFTRKIYRDAKIQSFPVQRFISCNVNKRKPVKELLAVWE